MIIRAPALLCRHFADNFRRFLITAEPQKDWVTHFTANCPLGEFYLAYEPGPQPRGVRFTFDLNVEGLGLGLQRLHLFVQRSQHLFVKARSRTPDIPPG